MKGGREGAGKGCNRGESGKVQEGGRALGRDLGGTDGEREPEGGGQSQMGGQGRQEGWVWGDPASLPPTSTPPQRPAPHASSRPLAGGSTAPAWASGSGAGSEARGRCVRAACARLCAQGRPGGRRHVEASLARVSRPVGKAGRRVRMARPPSLGFGAGDWGGGDCPPGFSGPHRDSRPEPELTREGEGVSQEEAEGPRLGSGRGRWGAGTQAARMGRGWRVR